MAGWPIALQSSHVQKSSFVLASLFIIVTYLNLLLVIIKSLLCVWRAGWIWLVEAFPNVKNCKCWWCHFIFFLLNLILASKVCFMLSKLLWTSSFNIWGVQPLLPPTEENTSTIFRSKSWKLFWIPTVTSIPFLHFLTFSPLSILSSSSQCSFFLYSPQPTWISISLPKPPHAKFNVGLNHDETKEWMNKTVGMMWMWRHPEEPASWFIVRAFKSRYSHSAPLTPVSNHQREKEKWLKWRYGERVDSQKILWEVS